MCFFLFPWHIITCMYQNILPCISDDFMESKHPLSQCVPPHSGSSRVVAKLSATDPIVFVFNEVFVLFPKCKQQTIYLRWQNKLTWAKIDFDRQHWTSIMNEFYFFIFSALMKFLISIEGYVCFTCHGQYDLNFGFITIYQEAQLGRKRM